MATIVASDAAAGDNFGNAVALSGDTALFVAHRDDENGSNSGSVHIFGRNEGGAENWGQVAKIVASDAAGGITH